MLATIIDELKNPQNIKIVNDNFEWLIKECSLEEKSRLALSILLEIYRKLDNFTWTENIDVRCFANCIVKLCKYVKCKSSKEIQNLFTVICHAYRFVIKKNIDLSISNPIFNLVFSNSSEHTSNECTKIYWIMLVDKINILEVQSMCNKYIQDLTECTGIIIEKYDLLEFYNSKLSWLIKKYYTLFNENFSNELEKMFQIIFQYLYKRHKSTELFNIKKTCTNSIYKTILHCLTLSMQNLISCKFKSSVSVDLILKISFIILKNNSELYNYIYIIKSVIPIFVNEIGYAISDSKSIFKKFTTRIHELNILKKSSEFNEFIMFFRKIFCLYIPEWLNSIDSVWKNNMTIEFEVNLLEIILYIMKALSGGNKQGVTCKDCKFKGSSHDALQIANCARQILVKNCNSDMRILELLPILLKIFFQQTNNIIELSKNGCLNWEKLWICIDKNYHTDAILFYTNNQSQASLELYEAYFICYWKVLAVDFQEIDIKNLTKAYYNSAVSQLSLNMFKEALQNCYLGLILTIIFKPNEDQYDKFMNCIIQIKSKALGNGLCCKNTFKKENDDGYIQCECYDIVKTLQLLNTWNICFESDIKFDKIISKKLPTINFRKILLYELEMYSKIWFSSLSIIGICNTLMSIMKIKQLPETNSEELLLTFGKVVTLIAVESNKFSNPQIREFIKCAMNFMDEHFQYINSMSTETIILYKLFYGNTLKSYYECIMNEKIENEAPPAFLSAPSQNSKSHLTVHPDDKCDIEPTQKSLTLSIEEKLIEPLLKAVKLWKEILQDQNSKTIDEINLKYKFYIDKTIFIMNILTQLLSLRCLDFYALEAADVAYRFATLCNNKINILRSTSFIIEQTILTNSNVLSIIDKANDISQDILASEMNDNCCDIDTVFEYLLSLVKYYYNCNLIEKGLLILTYVHNKILNEFSNDETKMNKIKFSHMKLTIMQSLYINYIRKDFMKENNINYISILTSNVNSCIQCLTTIKSSGCDSRQLTASLRMWKDCGLYAGKISLLLGLPRRARTILRSLLSSIQCLLLPVPNAEILLLLAQIDLATERFDDCNVKIDILDYIMGSEKSLTGINSPIQNTKITENVKLHIPVFTENTNNRQYETVLDVQIDKHLNYDIRGSPIFQASPFRIPLFVDHLRDCVCNKCSNISLYNAVLGMTHLKALLQYKIGEVNIGNSYFEGSLKLTGYLNARMEYIINNYKFENFTINNIDVIHYKIFSETEILFYVTMGYHFMGESNYTKAEILNKKSAKILSMFPLNHYLLIQLVKEQSVILLLNKIKFEESENISDVDILSNKMDKLQLTPEKLPPDTFKTPCKNNLIPPVQAQRARRCVGRKFNEDDDGFFNKPIAKFNLDDDKMEDGKNINRKKISKGFGNEKTPIPDIKVKHIFDEMESNDMSPIQMKTSSNNEKSNRNKISVQSSQKALKNKSQLLRSTSPGPLQKEEKSTCLRSSVKIKREKKINLSPDVDLVKKYRLRKKL